MPGAWKIPQVEAIAIIKSITKLSATIAVDYNL